MGPLGGRGCYLTHLQLSCQGFLLIRETISPSEMSSNSLTQCKLVCFVFALCPSRSLCLSATPKCTRHVLSASLLFHSPIHSEYKAFPTSTHTFQEFPVLWTVKLVLYFCFLKKQTRVFLIYLLIFDDVKGDFPVHKIKVLSPVRHAMGRFFAPGRLL